MNDEDAQRVKSEVPILSVLAPLDHGNPAPSDVARDAASAEAAGVDYVLIGYGSATPDGWPIAAYAMTATTRLRALVAHRPGVMHPVTAARLAATLHYLSNERTALNIVAGGAPGDQLREGDDLEKARRADRAAEYVDIMRQVWSADRPISFEGEFFKLERAFLQIRPTEPIPIFMGGASPGALQFGVRSADVYMLWGEPLAETRARVDEITDAARAAGTVRPKLSMSLRIVLGETSERAWERAERFVGAMEDRSGKVSRHVNDVGRQRQIEIARANVRHDTNFWAGITLASGGQGNTSALVGTQAEVVSSLAAYRDLGIDMFLLTGPEGGWSDELAPLIAQVREGLVKSG